MKILVLGSKGQLGQCLFDQFSNTSHEITFTSRINIDISRFNDTKKSILDIDPDVVINAAAYTSVDKAEEERVIADVINHLAVSNLAEICAELSCWLIHISTDYVFDGFSNKPYVEIDVTNPQGAYGLSKLKGELAIQASGCKYLIIRTSWVFSEYGNNFMKTMLRLGAVKNELTVVGDQIGCPTFAQDLAKAIVRTLDYLISEDVVGVYHLCGDKKCSWYEFAREIFLQAGEAGLSIPAELHSIATSEYPTIAPRPSYSVLNTKKFCDKFDVTALIWRNGITSVLKSLNPT